MHLPPPPDSRQLLPPLLACLPTAFVSLRPPPALLPLLSPLLRQRVNYLSSSTSSQSDGWLPLLSWNAEHAAKLPAIVEHMQLEPHPVSGEVEIDDVRATKYRRLDKETLHSRLEVEQFELLPIYVWCETDDHGGTGPGWKLAELKSLEDMDDDTDWYDSPSQANDAADTRSLAVPQMQDGVSGRTPPNSSSREVEGEEDDDDYWASYDRTPGRTPAQKHSPAPAALSSTQRPNQHRSQPEQDYYSRYGTEVQPALDAHDPDEDNPEIGESTLAGDSLLRSRLPDQPASRPNGTSLFPAASGTNQNTNMDVEAPRPLSPTSSHSSGIERLEEKAAAMSEAEASDRAQLAIKQHISTDIKSLFRLAKSSGMERTDFENIVRTELECLSLLEQDD